MIPSIIDNINFKPSEYLSKSSDELFVIEELNRFVDSIVKPLIGSFVAGEYLSISKYLDYLKNLVVINSNYIKEVAEINNEKAIITLTQISSLFNEILESIEKLYYSLLHYTTSESNPLIISQSSFKFNIPDDFYKLLSTPIKFLEISMYLAYIEYVQLFNLDSFAVLIENFKFMDKIENNERVFGLLKEKISLILYIIEITHKDHPALSLINREIMGKKIDYEKCISCLRKDKEHIERYYSNNISTIKDYYTDKYPYRNFYDKVYIANKIKSDVELLKNIKHNDSLTVELVHDEKDSLLFLYNEKVDRIKSLYIDNCVLSNKVKKYNSGKNDPKLQYEKEIQKNYYSATKHIEYYSIRISNMNNIDSDESEVIIDNLRSIIEDLNEINSSFLTSAVVPFKLPVEECIEEIDGFNILLLNNLIKTYPSYISKSIIDKSISKAYECISKITTKIEFSKEKNEIDAIRDEIKKNERRSIEIISIFSAIVMFVAGDLQLFKNITDLKSAIYLMLVFGFCLSVFVGLIMLLMTNMDTTLLKTKKSISWYHKIRYRHVFMFFLIIGLIAILLLNQYCVPHEISKVVFSLFNFHCSPN